MYSSHKVWPPSITIYLLSLPSLSPYLPSPLVITFLLSFSEFFICLLLFVLWHMYICIYTYGWTHGVLVPFWLTSFSIILSRSTYVVKNGNIASFYGWVVFHRIYVPHLYPISFKWHLGSFHGLNIIQGGTHNKNGIIRAGHL